MPWSSVIITNLTYGPSSLVLDSCFCQKQGPTLDKLSEAVC